MALAHGLRLARPAPTRPATADYDAIKAATRRLQGQGRRWSSRTTAIAAATSETMSATAECHVPAIEQAVRGAALMDFAGAFGLGMKYMVAPKATVLYPNERKPQ